MAISSDIKRKGVSKSGAQNPTLEINLKEMFDVPFFPENDRLRSAIGQAIIDKIKERTARGEFIEQSAGAQKYSKEYVESEEFQVYGKSQGEVNLRASGDMLENMGIDLPEDFNKLNVYFTDRFEAEKAHGHITGNVGKKRDFFGLTQKDINGIAREFEDRVLDSVLMRQASSEIRGRDEDEIDFLLRQLGG